MELHRSRMESEPSMKEGEVGRGLEGRQLKTLWSVRERKSVMHMGATNPTLLKGG
jgi:hypothetical protein